MINRYPDLFIARNAEYFLAITKQEGDIRRQHHSIILGAIDEYGNPINLARVGKNNDIDPDFAPSCNFYIKSLDDTLARVSDEGIHRAADVFHQVSYQAYSITFDQLNKFLHMISIIGRKQFENGATLNGIVELYKKNLYIGNIAEENPDDNEEEKAIGAAINSESIRSYVPCEPSEENSGLIQFKYKALCNCKQFAGDFNEDISQIVNDAQHLTVINTCRNTAIDILEKILGVAANIGKYFFASSLKYQMTLTAGVPDKECFYILPPPPAKEKADNLSPEQHQTLIKMYQRLEEIPTTNPSSKETRKKFNALKSLYKSMAGENNLSAENLLTNIMQHINQPETKGFIR